MASALTLGGQGFRHDRTAAFLITVATTVLLWRIYIHRSGQLLSSAFGARLVSPRMARWAGHVHLAMVAGLVVTAVGDELVIVHPTERTPLTWAVVMLGGPALFLLGRAGLQYLVFARVSPDRMLGLVVLIALAPAAVHLEALMTDIAVTVVTVRDQLRAQEIVPNAGLLNAKLSGSGAPAGLPAMAPKFAVIPGTTDAMTDSPVNVARSPLREMFAPNRYNTVCVAGIVKVTVQLPVDTVARFSTETWSMKFVPRRVRWTRQVGAEVLGVVNVSESERADWLPALSNATTATV